MIRWRRFIDTDGIRGRGVRLLFGFLPSLALLDRWPIEIVTIAGDFYRRLGRFFLFVVFFFIRFLTIVVFSLIVWRVWLHL